MKILKCINCVMRIGPTSMYAAKKVYCVNRLENIFATYFAKNQNEQTFLTLVNINQSIRRQIYG